MKLKFVVLLILMLFVSGVSATEYQLKRASELSIGDVIVASDGSEIVVGSLDYSGMAKQGNQVQESKSLMDLISGKLSGSTTGYVVSGGSSDVGLSLGNTGVGIKVVGGVVANEEFVENKFDEKVSFWSKLTFWRKA